MARRNARRAILEARARLLDRVFAAARGALPAAASGAAYRTSLAAALAAAITALGDAPAVVHAPAALIGDLERLRPSGGAVTVVADAETGSGFRVVAADGALEVDDTLESRLERLRPELARRVLARLALAP
jgi:vacuolar-type H+-ATPase subunit E/Vma4